MMSKYLKFGLAIAILAIILRLIFTYNEKQNQNSLARSEAEQFLMDHGLSLDEFEGPEKFSRSNVPEIFIWRSTSHDPKLRLELSLIGEQVCLYRVVSDTNYKAVACRDLDL